MKQGKDKKGFGVAASPFNGVKLELGVILCVGLLIWLVADSIIASLEGQLLLFVAYSLLATFWLLVRTRRVLRRIESQVGDPSTKRDEP